GSRTFRRVTGSVHCAMKFRVPFAVTRTPRPGHAVSKTNRSLRPPSTVKPARNRSVSFGTASPILQSRGPHADPAGGSAKGPHGDVKLEVSGERQEKLRLTATAGGTCRGLVSYS